MRKLINHTLFFSLFLFCIIISGCGKSPGNLSISTIPEGGIILIDDQLIGESPQEVKQLKAGMHVVELRMENYQNTKYNIEVVSRQTKEYNLSLLTGSIEDDIIKASRNNNVNVVKSLILYMQNNEGIDKYKDEINTALEIALNKSNLDVADVLLGIITENKDTILFSRFRDILGGDTNRNVCDFLIKNGVNIDTPLEDGTTLLLYYINKNDVERVEYLVDNNANVNFKTGGGITPLLAAIEKNNLSIFKILLFNDGDLNQIDEKKKAVVLNYAKQTVSTLTSEIRSRQGNINIGEDLDTFINILKKLEEYAFRKEYDQDVFRTAHYWIATHFFILKDFNNSITHYTEALRYVVSNKEMETDIAKLLTTVKKNVWKKELENEAPSYYITYNLACAYSRIDRYAIAFDWLRIALRINQDLLLKIIHTDKDIELLREQKEKFDRIIEEET